MMTRIARFPRGQGVRQLRPRLSELTHPDDQAAGTHFVGRVPFAPFVVPALLLSSSGQYAAFYDSERWLTVAHRRDWGGEWHRVRLSTRLAWDSHNFASLGIDSDGNVHLAANMHASPLVYFRTATPGDIESFIRHDVMVHGNDESTLTYPKFFVDNLGELSFWFRDGSSGAGGQRYYVWDSRAAEWIDPIGGPIIDGQQIRSPYPDLYQPHAVGGDRMALVWVWRDSPDAESTHTVSYALSNRFEKWRSAAGTPLDVPIQFGSAAEIGEWGSGRGLINNNVRVGHSADGSPVIVFHIRDHAGRMQIVSLRFDGGWIRTVLTDWDLTWDFAGRGSLEFDLEIGVPVVTSVGYHVDVRFRDNVARIMHDVASNEVSARPAEPPWLGITMIGDGATVRGLQRSPCGGGILTWVSSAPDRDRPQSDPLQGRFSSLLLVRSSGGSGA